MLGKLRKCRTDCPARRVAWHGHTRHRVDPRAPEQNSHTCMREVKKAEGADPAPGAWRMRADWRWVRTRAGQAALVVAKGMQHEVRH